MRLEGEAYQQFSFWHLMDFVGVPRLGEFG
jgi:hypothetical protein